MADHDGDAGSDEGDGRVADLAHDDQKQHVPVAVVGHDERSVLQLNKNETILKRGSFPEWSRSSLLGLVELY